MMKKTVKIRNMILGDGVPKICVPIVGKNLEEIASQAGAAAREMPDLAEWRVDFFEQVFSAEKMEEALMLLADILKDVPILFTCRTQAEGGEIPVTKEEYEMLNLWAAKRPEIGLIDVEGRQQERDPAALIRDIQSQGKAVIASTHFFHETPSTERMMEILKELENTGADIIKMAVMPDTVQDVWNLLAVTSEMDQQTEKPVITMSMGTLGCISRACGRISGSVLTFGAVGKASAPGQLPVSDLRRMLELL